jgi:hypothetical protein
MGWASCGMAANGIPDKLSPFFNRSTEMIDTWWRRFTVKDIIRPDTNRQEFLMQQSKSFNVIINTLIPFNKTA